MIDMTDQKYLDILTLLRPLIWTSRVFGTNYSASNSFYRALLIIYAALHYVSDIFVLIVFISFFDGDDGIKAATMLKLCGIGFVTMSLVCHSFNLKFQTHLHTISIHMTLINKGVIPHREAVVCWVKICCAVVSVAAVITSIFMYVVFASPLISLLKPKTFGSYDLTIGVALLSFLISSSITISLSYHYTCCSILRLYSEDFQTSIAEGHDKIDIPFLHNWFENYKLFLKLVEVIDSMFCWYSFVVNGLFFCILIVNNLLCARSMSLSPETIFLAFATTVVSSLFMLINPLPAVKVNETVNQTEKILWLASESDVIMRNHKVHKELQKVIKRLKLRGPVGLTAAKFYYPSRYSFLTVSSLFISYFFMFFRMDNPSNIITPKMCNCSANATL